ncbi:EamA family transporter [Actinomycetospora chiangmaiensis]|uniref:EamA family transporter n=1 Tax=Actinomycetospora chiangmaiensis TaxID=402650 RepID=UPI0005254F75|nr:EamA family transporter [Actinomycetospora chiangmaiensis]
MVSRSSTTSGLPAPLLFVLGGASMYVGAALAVGLFERVSPAGVAWLRLAGAAVVLAVWRLAARRWSRSEPVRWTRRRVLLAGAFGLVTAGMNIVFYEAIARLPLGTAVAVEFAGPVLVAALGSRSCRDWAALALVVLGVALIADVRLEGSPAGVVFALLAALLWAGYIVLGARVSSGSGSTGEGIDGLAIGFVVAAVVLSPLARTTAPIAGEPLLLGAALALGVLSSVVPYVLDQVVLRRVGRARFALLLALLPLTATVVGLVGLAQVPAPLEAVGIAAVVVGVALRREPAPTADPPPD